MGGVNHIQDGTRLSKKLKDTTEKRIVAPFVDAVQLVKNMGQAKVLNASGVDASDQHLVDALAGMEDEQRNIVGELDITERLMITGGEPKEDARLTRADRSASSARPSYVSAITGHVLRQLSATTRFVAHP